MTDRTPLCFTCGQPVGMDPFANRLANGEACPTCRERILEAAPAPMPRLVVDSEPEGADSPWGRGTEVGSMGDGWGYGPGDPDDPIGA